MTEKIDYLAKKIRTLILEIDKLHYVLDDIAEKYLDGYAEDEHIDHPIRKFSESLDTIRNTNNHIFEILVKENILDPSFRKALQKLATMDALKGGETAFVSFVKRHAKF